MSSTQGRVLRLQYVAALGKRVDPVCLANDPNWQPFPHIANCSLDLPPVRRVPPLFRSKLTDDKVVQCLRNFRLGNAAPHLDLAHAPIPRSAVELPCEAEPPTRKLDFRHRIRKW